MEVNMQHRAAIPQRALKCHYWFEIFLEIQNAGTIAVYVSATT